MGIAGGQSEGFVGVFDSGAGGISVLRSLRRALPHERFVYFGDSEYAPYGERSVEWIAQRTHTIAGELLAEGAKALVIACNTATSAAAATLRGAHPEVPIIGVEPALKPAALAAEAMWEGGASPLPRVLVMATQVTLHLDKFHRLAEEWADVCTVETVACDGLAARIEQGNLDAPDMHGLLEHLVGAYRGNVQIVVLGCTHYAFAVPQIHGVLGDVLVFDGRAGTARQTARLLGERGLLAPEVQEGSIELRCSGSQEQLKIYREFLGV